MYCPKKCPPSQKKEISQNVNKKFCITKLNKNRSDSPIDNIPYPNYDLNSSPLRPPKNHGWTNENHGKY